MSTPRLVVPGVALQAGPLGLDRDYARHARVLRLRAGDAVILCDGAGREMRAEVSEVTADSLSVIVQEEVAKAPEDNPFEITLLQGIAKGERMELVLQKTTELGVTKIVPVAMARSVAKYDKVPARWEKIIQEAARQCGRTRLPQLASIASPTASRSPLSIQADGERGEVRLLLDETGRGVRLKDALVPGVRGAVVLVGPEGGVTPEERAHFVAAGFTPVSLGSRILRTETAAIAIVTILQHHYGDLG